MPSFDVVVSVDISEVFNAVDQTKREVDTRYDFKGSKTEIDFKEKENQVILLTEDNMEQAAVETILGQKLAKRGISLKSVEFKPAEPAAGSKLRQVVQIKDALTQEELKRLAKTIKDEKMKVSPSIQGDQLRVNGKKRDDLQQCIQLLKDKISDLDLQFVNFRD